MNNSLAGSKLCKQGAKAPKKLGLLPAFSFVVNLLIDSPFKFL